MLITFTGRKSGKLYTTPVEYFYDGGTLTVFSSSERMWWRNLRESAPVSVRVKGRDYEGTAHASIGDAEVFGKALRAYLDRYPGREKYFGVGLDGDGQLNPDDVARVAQEKVVIEIDTA
jgi:deazaflavin-dependent oxidoreductase (nitroreductase family)